MTTKPALVSAPPVRAQATSYPTVLPRSGGYYLDDGPGDNPPPDLDRIPEPEPRAEPLHRFANNPYIALGQEYIPDRALRAYRMRGVASWYGRRFHGTKTSSGEVYDMYQLTAAHPTLPIPSYARVTHLQSGKSVVVRINDRGPFLHGRIIDLSYAGAARLGYLDQGSAAVEVQALLPKDGAPASVAMGALIPLTSREPPRAVGYPLVSDRDGVYVQLGAFSSQENAEILRQRMTPLALLEAKRLTLGARDGLHRVWAGPYDNRNEALAAALRLASDAR